MFPIAEYSRERIKPSRLTRNLWINYEFVSPLLFLCLYTEGTFIVFLLVFPSPLWALDPGLLVMFASRLEQGDAVRPWRFFVFQVPDPVASWSGSIWARAVRLVHAYLSDDDRPQAPTIYGDDFLHTLSMLTLWSSIVIGIGSFAGGKRQLFNTFETWVGLGRIYFMSR